MPWTPLCQSEHLPLRTQLQMSENDQRLLLYRDPYSRKVYALYNHNPLTLGANLHQGEVVHIGEHPVLSVNHAHFSLATGDCLEIPAMAVEVVRTREWQQQIEIYLPTH
ncbi:nitrite reductase (NAD(P)H) small subunit [Ferrimonas balearica]|uniref:nitrite reductase (NAD(P)H) small subunit n=1 Tax=Ferrimonas balearica TaxID=44012 RepID=UPI001C99B685|nr:nitrite reductase (NAD(P)H) small subunit [Ferrimonas balearica]MBY5992810.1 nitrite reductase (NAD(P)H) small subunit [Ferrimonas balearica]